MFTAGKDAIEILKDGPLDTTGDTTLRTSHMMKKVETLFQFPCQYTLKVMGRNTSEFYAAVVAIIEKRLPDGHEVTYSTRLSSESKYMSVTATFQAQSRDQLTAIYDDLKKSQLVMMTV